MSPAGGGGSLTGMEALTTYKLKYVPGKRKIYTFAAPPLIKDHILFLET
jgi:hypothetical protein